MSIKKFSFIGFIAVMMAVAPVFFGEALAGECGADPVYEKNFQAVAIISSRVRDIACMDGSEVMSVINQGATVSVVGQTDGWYKVKLSDGRQGWVGATLLKAITENTEDSSKVNSPDKKKADTKEKNITKSDPTLVNRVTGYILLQVQQRGEAYYVAEDGVAYYMKDGGIAYEMMRQFGLGINKANLAKLKAKNSELANRLKGRIVLDVETNGEAYYIYPKDGSLHYLKNGEEAYKIMRKLGLGISNADLKQIAKKEIKDTLKAKKTSQKTEQKIEKSPVTYSGGRIMLKAAAEGEKVVLDWMVDGMEAPMGFKVLYAKEANPVYPGNQYHYLSDAQVRSDYWKGLSAGTYHFRVCEYRGGACGVYSNDVQVTIESVEETVEQSGTITLSASRTDIGVNLTWTLTDMVSDQGFKVVWNTSENPVYPGDEYHYLSDKSARADTISGLEVGQTYHFRVCEYLSGTCGAYSNNVSLMY